jgi:hypothetical protein
MRCAICGQPIGSDQPFVPTADGGMVHVVCADQEAANAWATHRRRALTHALVVAIAGGVLPLLGYPLWLVVLIGTGLIAHPLIHRRIWHYLLRDIRRWLRGW